MISSWKNTKHLLASLSIFLVLLIGSAFAQESPSSVPEKHGIDPSKMDTSVRPGDDFFEYSDGSWLKRTEIPPDRGGIGTFTLLDILSNKRTSALIKEAAISGGAAGSSSRKIADL